MFNCHDEIPPSPGVTAVQTVGRRRRAPHRRDAPLISKDVITLTGATGITWEVTNGPTAQRTTKTYTVGDTRTMKVPAGENPVVTVEPVTIGKTAATDYSVTGTTSWDAAALKVNSEKGKITAAPAPVKKDDAAVQWKVNGKTIVKVAAGTKAEPVTVTVTGCTVEALAINAVDYAVKGKTTWSTTELGLTDANVAITFDQTDKPVGTNAAGVLKDTVTITPAAGIDWFVNGVKVSATKATDVSTKGVAAVKVTAKGKTADYAVKGETSVWEKKDYGITRGQLKPAAPALDKDAHAVKLTQTPGVIWKIDGVTVKVSTKVAYVSIPATKSKVVVTAVPATPADAEVVQNASTTLDFTA